MKVIIAAALLLTANAEAQEELDYGRTCLALAAFSEARSEGITAMYEVALVALRRATDPKHRWPQAICDVIEQPDQFVGVSTWPYPRHPELTEPNAWKDAQFAADKAISANGIGNGPCNGAYYFNESGAPGYVCKLGALFFYGDTK